MHLVVQVNDMTIEEEIKAFKILTDKMYNTYKKKHKDYGQTNTDTWDKFGPVSMLTRMYDKLGRLDNLLVKQQKRLVLDESIDDTLLDLANYALMTLLEVQKRRLENENKDRRLNT